MVLSDLIAELHCPYCGSGFDQEVQLSCVGSENCYGIIRCACYRYPVIDGIPILKQLSGPADILDKGVEYLEAGNAEGALHWALSRTSPIFTSRTGWRRMVDFLGRKAPFLAPNLAYLEQQQVLRRLRDESLTFQQALLFLRPAAYAQYLFHRYANNSFLASLAILCVLPVSTLDFL